MPTEPLAVAIHLGQLQVVGEEVDRCAMAWAQEMRKLKRSKWGKEPVELHYQTQVVAALFSRGQKVHL